MEFPQEVIDAARKADEALGIFASVTLAQWALESNWGRSIPKGSNNPFGIKAVGDQPYVEVQTHEYVKGKRVAVTARFAKFASLDDAFDRHAELLVMDKRYRKAICCIHADDFADALTGTYATDPKYGAKLRQVMRAHDLYRYDEL